MLSRVADSLYWMSRYFERADHCARVFEANYNLMLNPSKLSTEERWHRIMASLGIAATASGFDLQKAMIKLTSDPEDESSIVSCIAESRENAGQVREQISSEMWECLNRLYHEVTQNNARPETDSDPLRLVAAVREGSYQFHGLTDATMNHGEGWHFIQLGKYMERSCALPVLLDAYFSAAGEADDLDWVGLLASCAAFESYCKVYTADLKPDSMAEVPVTESRVPVFRALCGRADERGDRRYLADVLHKGDRPDRTYCRTAARFPGLRSDCRHHDGRAAPLPQRCHRAVQ